MLTKLELQELHAMLGALLPPYYQLDVGGVVRAGQLRDRLAHEIATVRPVEEKGVMVLRWTLPIALAPRLNTFAFMKGWQKKRLCKELDALLLLHIQLRDAKLNGAQKKRWVRVTRFSPKLADEESVDVIGGKLPLDALTRAGVFVDDDQRWLVREALCRKCKPGESMLVVEVFEVTSEGQHAPEPEHEVVAAPKRGRGEVTKAIVSCGAPARP